MARNAASKSRTQAHNKLSKSRNRAAIRARIPHRHFTTQTEQPLKPAEKTEVKRETRRIFGFSFFGKIRKSADLPEIGRFLSKSLQILGPGWPLWNAEFPTPVGGRKPTNRPICSVEKRDAEKFYTRPYRMSSKSRKAPAMRAHTPNGHLPPQTDRPLATIAKTMVKRTTSGISGFPNFFPKKSQIHHMARNRPIWPASRSQFSARNWWPFRNPKFWTSSGTETALKQVIAASKNTAPKSRIPSRRNVVEIPKS